MHTATCIHSARGRTWSTPSETSAWAVFPQLRVLPSLGALVLTAGRPGLGLWLADGRAGAAAAAGTTAAPFSWKFYNLAKEHNALLKKSASRLQFLAPEIAVMNASSTPSTPALTKAYTGLETTGCDVTADDRAHAEDSSSSSSSSASTTCTLVVSYDRLSNGDFGPDFPGHPPPHGPVDAAFTMRVAVKAM
jgi:hypothetical protein